MDFGMAAPMGSLPRAEEDEEIKREMQEMRNKLKGNVGRIKLSINQKTVDLATHHLNQLKEIETLPFPKNVEAFKKFKQEYSINF